MLVGNAIINADPLVPMIVGTHAVVEHVSAFLNELSQEAAGPFVLGVLVNVIHE